MPVDLITKNGPSSDDERMEAAMRGLPTAKRTKRGLKSKSEIFSDEVSKLTAEISQLMHPNP